ncbi:hypothetical protein [Burkholderia contaminans]|uniref:hypothetical protein n=1 Tax=Burkholderia contaminans TaxID=488447 RepID=UPI003BF85BC4
MALNWPVALFSSVVAMFTVGVTIFPVWLSPAVVPNNALQLKVALKFPHALDGEPIDVPIKPAFVT